MENSNFLDPANALAKEHLIENLEKESSVAALTIFSRWKPKYLLLSENSQKHYVNTVTQI